MFLVTIGHACSLFGSWQSRAINTPCVRLIACPRALVTSRAVVAPRAHCARTRRRARPWVVVSFRTARMAAAGVSFRTDTRTLASMVDARVSVITNDGRHIVGVLRGFDQVVNVILEDCHERVYSTTSGVEHAPLGLYMIRGDNMCVLCSCVCRSCVRRSCVRRRVRRRAARI